MALERLYIFLRAGSICSYVSISRYWMQFQTRTRSMMLVTRWKNRDWRRWLLATVVERASSEICWISSTCTKPCYVMRMESLITLQNSLLTWTTSGL